MRRAHLCLAAFILTGIALADPGHARIDSNLATLELKNDGFTSGGSAAFQAGFIAGEMAAVRLVPTGPTQIQAVHFLYGGSSGTRDIILHIWNDTGATAPGTELFSQTYSVTASDVGIQEIDLSSSPVSVSGAFRVGIEFLDDGLPSVARDDDGTITASLNFIFASGFGWVQSALLGLTGDWIIRAVVDDPTSTFTVGGTVSGLAGTLVLQNNGGDDLVITSDGPFTFATPLANGAAYDVTVLSEPAGQDCSILNGSGTIAGADVTNVAVTCSSTGSQTELANDGFTSGGSAGFQAGFVIGEIAAVRLVPPAATQVQAVRFLYGGAQGTRDIVLHIWNDTGALAPGTELFSQTYSVTASDVALQEIDLSGAPVSVGGPFRVGIEFLDDGLPSVARDDDGTIAANLNFVFASGFGWVQSATLGLTGDWIIRAVVDQGAATQNDPAILAIDDIGNDQGRSVRVRFAASGQDSPSSLQPVVRYEAFRRIDPLPIGLQPGTISMDGWEFVGSVPSHGEPVYNLVAPTLADSTSSGIHWSVFFIRAATESPFVFYDSVADSGYSIDNLAPGAPQNLVLAADVLSWDPAPEPDFAYWSVYGSDTPQLGPSSTLLGSTAANGFSVTGISRAYYLVTAHDFAGNEGAPAAVAGSAVGTEPPLVPRVLAVSAAPNPFNPTTRIRYDLPAAGPVRLELFDPRGRLVETLLEGTHQTAGTHYLDFHGRLPSGIYLLSVESAGDRRSIKLAVMQ